MLSPTPLSLKVLQSSGFPFLHSIYTPLPSSLAIMAEDHSPKLLQLNVGTNSRYLQHSRKSSANTTNTNASNTTYTVLDYYAANDTDDEGASFLNRNISNTNNMSTHSPTKSSHLRDFVANDSDEIKEEEDEGEEDDPEEEAEDLDGTVTDTDSHSFTSPVPKQSHLTMHENSSSSHITKHETLDSLKTSRANFLTFKQKINDIVTIKDTASSTFSSNFRNKSQLKKTIKNSEFDRYGFKKTNQYISTKDYNDWWDEYCPHLIRRKTKWIKFLEKNGLYLSNDGIPSRFPVKSEEMSKFVKKGVPAEWRGRAWFSFVHGNEKIKENKGLYEELVKQTIDLVNENTDAIEKDLHRTFPENIYFKNYTDPSTNTEQESPMLNTLRRVLKCFSLYKPTIGYCQSLNFITGLLLLFMGEEETFWMLVIITEKFLPGVHESNLEGLAVNQGMLLLCLKQHLPDVWKIIMDNDRDDYDTYDSNNDDDTSYLFFLPTLTFCTTNWFMSLFIGVLPIETTLRIWDIIFYEDSKTIFQICLGIFKMLDPELRKTYCRAHGLPTSTIVSQLTLHSDTDLHSTGLNSLRVSRNNLSSSNLSYNGSGNNSFNSVNSSFNKELLSSELFQLIQNTPKRIVNVNLFIEECFRHDSSSFCKLTQPEIQRCRNFVISSRERHSTLIEKRKELGMSPEERRELLRQERELSMNGLGLHSVWEHHHDKGKKKRSSGGSKSKRNSNSNDAVHDHPSDGGKKGSSISDSNSDNSGITGHALSRDVMGKTGRGLRTAYWNVGLNRRIKKIYSKGPDSSSGF